MKVKTNRIPELFLLIIMISMIVTACEKRSIDTVSDCKGGYVYVPENNRYVPYIVISTNYDGNTLLLRKNVLQERRRINEYLAQYTDSEMDKYLNSAVLASYSNNMQKQICNTSVEVLKKNYYQNSSKETEIIKRRVFLLSATEVFYTTLDIMGKEGRRLRDFPEAERIPQTEDGEDSSWWLRSAEITYDSCTFYIAYDGSLGSTNAHDAGGVRPAFCLPNDTPVVANSELVEDEIVYVVD